jgi:hypothetical protein
VDDRRDVDDWFEPDEDLTEPTVRRRLPVGGRGDGPPEGPSPLVLAAIAAAVVLLLIVGGVALFGGDDDVPEDEAIPTEIDPPVDETEEEEEPQPAEPEEPAPTLPEDQRLGPGDEGEAVMQLQRALAQLGFDPGEPDGAFGEQTRLAVQRFQESAGLAADGIAGPETLRALNQQLAQG